MNRRPILSNEMPVNKGYRHTRLNLSDYVPTSHWIVIQEDLERTGDGGIVVPDQKFSVLGRVLAVGPDGTKAGIKVGDKIVYEQWMGGKWAFTVPINTHLSSGFYFEEVECLIMSMDSVWCIVREI